MQQPHIVPYAEVWKADVERLCARIWGPERQQYRYGGYLEVDAGGTKEPSSYVAQVRYAKQLGLERLYSEIDTTDVWALPMLDFFPFEPVPAWVTYQC